MANQKTQTGLLIAAAVAAVGPFTTKFEGTVLHAYRDPAGIATECTGETKNVRWGVHFTRDQCQEMLDTRMEKDFAPEVLKCVPSLADADKIKVFEASLDAAYNAGPAAFCKSPMAEAFRAGMWDQGCAAFIGWRVTAKGDVLPGLVTRRRQEAALCAEGI